MNNIHYRTNYQINNKVMQRNQKGTAMIEYAILVATVVGVAVGAIQTVGQATSTSFQKAGNALAMVRVLPGGEGGGAGGNGN